VQPRRALVLDLDYTLLHLEATSSAIEVPGRTRSAYLAAETVDALSDLRERYDIFLATARSWHGTRPVVEGLARRGVTVTGVVLEDGALLGPPGEHRPLEPGRDWEGLRRALGAALPDLPFSWQEDFEACLVARSETSAEAETLLAGLGGEASPDLVWRCLERRNRRRAHRPQPRARTARSRSRRAPLLPSRAAPSYEEERPPPS